MGNCRIWNSRRIDNAGIIFTGAETANATMSGGGLTLDQNAADNEILAFKSSDVAHGMTTLSETDTYGTVQKGHATGGGLKLSGWTDTHANAYGAVVCEGVLGEAANTDKDTGGFGIIHVNTFIKSGTGRTDPGANSNLMSISGGSVCRFIFDQEGSGHADVEWTTYDTHDDIALINDMESEVLLREDEAQTDRRHALEATGIIGKDSWHMENGRPRAMVNFTKLAMLHHGALIQIGQAYDVVRERLDAAELKLKMLEAV